MHSISYQGHGWLAVLTLLHHYYGGMYMFQPQRMGSSRPMIAAWAHDLHTPKFFAELADNGVTHSFLVHVNAYITHSHASIMYVLVTTACTWWESAHALPMVWQRKGLRSLVCRYGHTCRLTIIFNRSIRDNNKLQGLLLRTAIRVFLLSRWPLLLIESCLIKASRVRGRCALDFDQHGFVVHSGLQQTKV